MTADKQRINLAMARACIGARDVVKRAGIPRPTFNNVVTGRSVRPETLGKIARALDVDVEYLIAKEER